MLFGKRAAFWLAVAGVAVIANFGVELLAQKTNLPGLQQFVQFTHCGPGMGGNS